MTNHPLLRFLLGFPPPATAKELFGEINSLRAFEGIELDDLPFSLEATEESLGALERAGLVVCVDGRWGVRVREPVKERMLFA